MKKENNYRVETKSWWIALICGAITIACIVLSIVY